MSSLLKTARKALGLTQAELADAIGITPSAIIYMEKDDSPSPKVLKYLAEEHDISPLYLLLGDEYPMTIKETMAAREELKAKMQALLNE